MSVLYHWNYFLSLDQDVSNLARYVEPTPANYSCFSLELARLLFAAASEVDVVAKQLCKKLSPKESAESIAGYRKVLLANFPDFSASQVEIPRFGITLRPWEAWSGSGNPAWWSAYNNVKHHRHTHFADANLEHALHAVAGLFVLLLYFYPEEAERGRLSPDPALFRASGQFYTDRLMWGDGAMTYKRIGAGQTGMDSTSGT